MILHADAHWVTVAAVNDDIVYMDSMRPHRPITPYVIRQLFASKVDEYGKLKVKIIPRTPAQRWWLWHLCCRLGYGSAANGVRGVQRRVKLVAASLAMVANALS